MIRRGIGELQSVNASLATVGLGPVMPLCQELCQVVRFLAGEPILHGEGPPDGNPT